jgi:hypothetical protein
MLPSDDDVADQLIRLGATATAAALCDALVAAHYTRPNSQLAIQRAIERGRILMKPDWQVYIP